MSYHLARIGLFLTRARITDYRLAARGYISASLITTSSSENISQFIVTQGPLPQTYEDFWEMVMQYRCPVVVMLTRLVHNYKMVKCGDYFQAKDGPREFGNIHIVTKWIKTTDTSVVLRHLEVKYKEAYSAIHFQWSWNPFSSKMYHMMHGPKSNEKEECKSDPKVNNKYEEIMSTNIPRRKSRRGWLDDTYQQYEGFWCDPYALEGLLWAQDHFKPQPNHLILSSAPKSGTTWLKAISFAIVTRSRFSESTNPLLTRLSHDLVPFLEFELHLNPQTLDVSVPLVATHIPYTSLPKAIINSGCRIVYICRDPKDVFVSLWHFVRKMSPKAAEDLATEDLCLEDAFQLFCEGISLFGPYWDHVLGYWRASLESPERVLFLKYEDLKNETEHWVKKMAQFMGYPFSVEEEEQGMVQKIINLCSFENLSSLEVNKSGITRVGANLMVFKNNTFFRKGKVGDWKNHLTPEMVTQLDQITEQKLKGSGLTFHV